MNISTMFLAFLQRNVTADPTHESSLFISLTFDVPFPCLAAEYEGGFWRVPSDPILGGPLPAG